MCKLKDFCIDNPMETISGATKEKENPYILERDRDDDERLKDEEWHARDFESFFNNCNRQ